MLLATLALSFLPQAAPAGRTNLDPFFAAQTPIVVPTQEEADATKWCLADLVRDYERSTGHLLVATPAAEWALRACPTLCEDPQVFAPEGLQVRFEDFIQGFNLILLPPSAGAPRLVGLATRRAADIEQLSLEPWDIDWTEAEQVKDRASTIYRTIVPIQGADARRLSNKLRGQITDANVCRAVPLAGSNCVLIQGTGKEVARLTRALREPAREAGWTAPTMETSEFFPQRDGSTDAALAGLSLTIPARGEESAEGNWNLADLCAAYSKLTGVPVTMKEDAATQAEATLVGLSQDLTLAGYEVPLVFESLCRAKGFFLTPAEQGGLILDDSQRGEPAVAMPQKLADLGSFAFQPARVVEVDFPMRNFDPRIMANVMRAFSRSPKTDGMKVEPGSQVLTLRGFGPQVAGKIVLFQRAEEMADAMRAADPNREE